MKKYFIVGIVVMFFPITVSATINQSPNNNVASCPVGYTYTPTPTASITNLMEKIFYISPAYATSSLNDLQTNVSSGDIVAPQMYTVDANLEATGSVPDQIKDVAKSRGIKIMPLITNDGFTQTLIHDLLASTTAQNSVISYLVSEAENNGYIGWQFDFEHMEATDSEPYTAFVEKAATALHENNLILSVTAVARTDDATSTPFYQNWSGAYDYAQLAKYVDFISLMTYDDPNSVGPTASIPYDTSVLTYLSSMGVPPDKISLGIPFFYYGWDITTPPGIINPFPGVPSPGFGEVVNYGGIYSRWQYVRTAYGASEIFNSALGAPYSIYYLDNHEYEIWYDNSMSIQMKLELAQSFHLRGFSVWALGQEFPDVWNAIDQYICI
jgi:spore germination protein YaaH